MATQDYRWGSLSVRAEGVARTTFQNVWRFFEEISFYSRSAMGVWAVGRRRVCRCKLVRKSAAFYSAHSFIHSFIAPSFLAQTCSINMAFGAHTRSGLWECIPVHFFICCWLTPQHTPRCNWRWQSALRTVWEVWKVSVSLKTANKHAGTHAKAIKEASYQAYLSKYDALKKDALHKRVSTHTQAIVCLFWGSGEGERGKKKPLLASLFSWNFSPALFALSLKASCWLYECKNKIVIPVCAWTSGFQRRGKTTGGGTCEGNVKNQSKTTFFYIIAKSCIVFGIFICLLIVNMNLCGGRHYCTRPEH